MEVRKGRRDSGLARRFIFLTGGVVFSLGKGLTAATRGALPKARGVRLASRTRVRTSIRGRCVPTGTARFLQARKDRWRFGRGVVIPVWRAVLFF